MVEMVYEDKHVEIVSYEKSHPKVWLSDLSSFLKSIYFLTSSAKGFKMYSTGILMSHGANANYMHLFI